MRITRKHRRDSLEFTRAEWRGQVEPVKIVAFQNGVGEFRFGVEWTSPKGYDLILSLGWGPDNDLRWTSDQNTHVRFRDGFEARTIGQAEALRYARREWRRL